MTISVERARELRDNAKRGPWKIYPDSEPVITVLPHPQQQWNGQLAAAAPDLATAYIETAETLEWTRNLLDEYREKYG